jgi:Flp pilus assembly protein TadG
MYKRWQEFIKDFSENDRGSVMMIFGLMAFVLFTVCALAVDYSKALNVRSRTVGAVDSASLAAGRAMLDGKMTEGEIVTLATNFFNANIKVVKNMAAVGSPSIVIDRDAGTVNIDVNSTVTTTFGRFAGLNKLDIPVSSAATYKSKDVEVGMALDITGSMNDSVGGQRKIDALKSAFDKFADRLIPDQKTAGQKVRIGLAPYASGINLGKYAGDVTDLRSTDGCVTERRSGEASDNAVPKFPKDSVDNQKAFLVKADGVDDVDPVEGLQKGAFHCPPSVAMPLSDDKNALKASVNSYQPDSWTGGHLGIQWAWNMISDKWGSNWGGGSSPDSYQLVKDGKLLKAVVLMTDGIFNTSFHGKSSAQQATELCSSMKSLGVVVFAVAFNAPADAQKTLKACATAGTQYYANANSPKELQDAFDSFAGQLSQLRITK